jgi:hypothetical protein
MDKEQLPWRSFADTADGTSGGMGKICGDWNLEGTPTLFIVDHNGVIRHKWLGGPGEKVIDEALEKLIKEAEGGKKPSN